MPRDSIKMLSANSPLSNLQDGQKLPFSKYLGESLLAYHEKERQKAMQDSVLSSSI